MGEKIEQLNLNASDADGEKAINSEGMTDGEVTIDGDQYSQPYRRTLSHVAQWIHILHT